MTQVCNVFAPEPQGLFDGDFSYLVVIVKISGNAGQWERGENFWRFRYESGGWLNWWEETGFFNIVAPPERRVQFAKDLVWAYNAHDIDIAELLAYQAVPSFEFGLSFSLMEDE